MKVDTKSFLRLLDSISPEANVAASPLSADTQPGVSGEQGGIELRGNNLKVQFNILEAAVVVLSEAIATGEGRKFIHPSGKHKGRLNCSALAAHIDDHRHRFAFLAPATDTGDGLRPGADRDKIAEKLSMAIKQELSEKFGARTRGKESEASKKNGG